VRIHLLLYELLDVEGEFPGYVLVFQGLVDLGVGVEESKLGLEREGGLFGGLYSIASAIVELARNLELLLWLLLSNFVMANSFHSTRLKGRLW
jgi:hypothetical protein